MLTTSLLLLLTAPLTLCARSTTGRPEIDADTLVNVFGTIDSYKPNHQVPAVVPETLSDPDYWDSNDEFAPANIDYDKFDLTLTKRIAATTQENFLLSPLGLKLALAILTEAATGATKAELESVLDFDKDRVKVRNKFSNILTSLNAISSQYVLHLGSRVYLSNATPRQKFAAVASEFYRTEVINLDFTNPVVACNEINSWVSNTTHGKIRNLVSEDDVSNMIVLILNTLYFKGNWRHQFAPNATDKAPFYVTPNLTKQVPFMNVKDKYFYAESNRFDAKILRMPYLGQKFSMYLVVPNSLKGLARVTDNLSFLRAELNYLQENIVEVTLPKFQFDYTSILDEVLRELGVRQAFEDTASFPGLSRGQALNNRLKVSRVLQRSGIEVNEIGSVAYSATEIGLENKFGTITESYREVVANKPFLFFIEDEGTRQLLFTGRVSDPSQADGAFKLS